MATCIQLIGHVRVLSVYLHILLHLYKGNLVFFNLNTYSRFHIDVITYVNSKTSLDYYIQLFSYIRVIKSF
jgi:hypothetical protein